MAQIPDLKNYSKDQLEKLIDKARRERDRIEKGAEELVDKVESLLKEHGIDFDELVSHFRSKGKAGASKKTRRKKKTTRKKAAKKTSRKKATRKKAASKKAASKKSAGKKKATRKKAARKKTAKKATAKKATRKKGYKVPPKYRNPDNASETWTGRGRKPKWVEAALASGKSLDDLKI